MPHKRAALHQVLALITVCRVWTESDANDEGKRVGVCCRVLCAAKRTTCSGAGHFAMVLTSVLVQARAHSSSAAMYCISLAHLCTVCLCTKATVRAMAVMESELHLLPLAFFLPPMLLLLLGVGEGACPSIACIAGVYSRTDLPPLVSPFRIFVPGRFAVRRSRFRLCVCACACRGSRARLSFCSSTCFCFFLFSFPQGL